MERNISGALSGQAYDIADVENVLTNRINVLQSLAEAPKHNRDLQADLDVSRSTAYKALSSLEGCSLIERTDRGYILTLTGRLLLSEYRNFSSNIADIWRFGGLLSVFLVDSCITNDVVRGAECEFANSYAPHSPVAPITQAIRDATKFRAASPVVLPKYVEVVHKQRQENAVEATIILETPALDHIEDQHPRLVADASPTGRVEIRATDRPIPFGLLVVDQPDPEVFLIVHGTDGSLKGFLRNTTETAVEWGRETWSDFRVDSRCID